MFPISTNKNRLLTRFRVQDTFWFLRDSDTNQPPIYKVAVVYLYKYCCIKYVLRFSVKYWGFFPVHSANVTAKFYPPPTAYHALEALIKLIQDIKIPKTFSLSKQCDPQEICPSSITQWINCCLFGWKWAVFAG